MKHVAAVALFTLALPVAAETVVPTRAVVPVAGSTAGAFGSNFKTELQLNNRSPLPLSGTIIFREQGKAGSASDAVLQYQLEPHQTMTFDDIVSRLGRSGLGSLDIVSTTSGLPTVVARAYNDGGDLGTSGATVPAVRTQDAIVAGGSSLLVAPNDSARYRFNIGIRTLDAGARIRVSVFDKDGHLIGSSEETTLAPNYFVQQTAAAFAGRAVPADASVYVDVFAGSAVVYGTTTDNTTNDPSVQIAQ